MSATVSAPRKQTSKVDSLVAARHGTLCHQQTAFKATHLVIKANRKAFFTRFIQLLNERKLLEENRKQGYGQNLYKTVGDINLATFVSLVKSRRLHYSVRVVESIRRVLPLLIKVYTYLS